MTATLVLLLEGLAVALLGVFGRGGVCGRGGVGLFSGGFVYALSVPASLPPPGSGQRPTQDAAEAIPQGPPLIEVLGGWSRADRREDGVVRRAR